MKLQKFTDKGNDIKKGIFLRKRKTFFQAFEDCSPWTSLCVILTVLATMGAHLVFPRFTSSAKILVKMGSDIQDRAEKNNPSNANNIQYVDRYISTLNSREFFYEFATLLEKNADTKSLVNDLKAEMDDSSPQSSEMRKLARQMVRAFLPKPVSDNTKERFIFYLSEHLLFRRDSGSVNPDTVLVRGSFKTVNESLLFTNEAADFAVKFLKTRELAEMNAIEQSYINELNKYRSDYEKLSKSTAKEKAKLGILLSDSVAGFTNGKLLEQKVANLEKEILTSQSRVMALSKYIHNYDKQLSELNRNVNDAEKNGDEYVIADTLRQKIDFLRSKVALYKREGFTEDSQDVQSFKNEIQEASLELSNLLKTSPKERPRADWLTEKREIQKKLDEAKAESAALQTNIQLSEEQLKRYLNEQGTLLPEAEEKLADIQQRRSLAFSMAEAAERKVFDIRLIESTLNNNFSVIEYETLESMPANLGILPKFFLAFLLSFVLSGLVAQSIVQARERRTPRSALAKVVTQMRKTGSEE